MVEDTGVVQNGGTRGRGEEAVSRKPKVRSDAELGQTRKGGRRGREERLRGVIGRLCASILGRFTWRGPGVADTAVGHSSAR